MQPFPGDANARNDSVKPVYVACDTRAAVEPVAALVSHEIPYKLAVYFVTHDVVSGLPVWHRAPHARGPEQKGTYLSPLGSHLDLTVD